MDSVVQSPCNACGACCSYSADWPRFTLEDDADIARLPPVLVSDTMSGMRCDGDRCCALSGKVGVTTSCRVYAQRPDVCRACQPGDEACTIARERFGLKPLTA
jgi:Fe-S-cluster containining protein